MQAQGDTTAKRRRANGGIVARRSPVARAKVSNGSALFMGGVDGRSAEARRFHDILCDIFSDLGGFDCLSEGQRQLSRRCALLSTQCEKLEAQAVAGQDIDLDVYGQLTDRLGRAFHRLGLKRISRDVTPTISEIVARHQGRRK